jgi:CBS domain-containing protein
VLSCSGSDEETIPVMTTVKDVMTTSVVAVPQTAQYKEIATILRQRRISAVPVLNDARQVVGVVSEADLLRKLTAAALPTGTIRLAWRLRIPTATAVTAAELMTTPAITVGPEETVAGAARLMQDRQVKRLPVVDGTGQLVGIVSRADVLSVFQRPDEQIRDEVVNTVITEEFALNPSTVAVTVRSGVVTVTGPISRRAIALALLGKIRFLDGVVAVRDRLTYPPEDYGRRNN